MQTITIVGIGHVGRLILHGLLQYRNPLYINLVDIGNSAPGYAMDAFHAALIDDFHQISFNNDKTTFQSDYIFHCAGPSVPLAADRTEIISLSKEITRTIFQNKPWNPNAKVIVITNPVEPVCKYVSEFSGIAENRVFGTGTSIDTIRLKYFLAKEFTVHPEQVQTLMVGEHGAGMLALKSQTLINHQPIINQQKWNSAVANAFNAANHIKSFTGYTSFGPAQAAIELWKVLTKQKTSLLPFSCANSKDAIPNHPDFPSWCSLPIQNSNNSITASLPDSITENENEQLLVIANKLVNQTRN